MKEKGSRDAECRELMVAEPLYRYIDTFPTKKVTFSETEETRRRGRQPARWLNDVEKYHSKGNQPMEGHRDR
ncbi:hypothetical protein TNCV_350961 [Trichonephila clavipes]|nr:hypothetical protein TNCV_350961 [Trichonephila clavipes]